ncbi:hypothetical protein C4568_03650 [Candidatus Parcubacteria bacterium]|nr:MAG: hypothetical protein C4568_03650 [Candidatus Parcubacteria bacterium]
MTNKEIIEQNAEEKREIDWDLKEMCLLANVDKNDIDNVLAAVYGENDGADWHYIVLMKDGEHAYISGGCDYTGWDCQASASLVKKGSLDEVVEAVPEEENYYKRGNLREHLKKQLAHEMPFGLISQ